MDAPFRTFRVPPAHELAARRQHWRDVDAELRRKGYSRTSMWEQAKRVKRRKIFYPNNPCKE